ncbi:hypothetical protein B1H18_10865 [Streptomyces tsukubensis]|uniref:Histidine kinase/HSP90-like ATPase domain-containing protein n=1 Tax=Streptomyces tsukubensis TaxID=83656 RepID=A0A1V4ABY8_9ACTN|nr:hypothetical protein B1H18_10865 [Streptomyces tsukubensis]
MLLVTSELVTNALRHGGGLVRFTAKLREGHVEMEVGDRSAIHPTFTPKEPGDPVPGGYGWPLIRRLSAEVTIAGTPTGGKVIRVLIPLAPLMPLDPLGDYPEPA